MSSYATLQFRWLFLGRFKRLRDRAEQLNVQFTCTTPSTTVKGIVMITSRSQINFAERCIIGALTSGLKVLVVASCPEDAKACALAIQEHVPGIEVDSTGDYKSRYRAPGGGSLELAVGVGTFRGRSYNLIACPHQITDQELSILRNRACLSSSSFTMIALRGQLFSE